MNFLFGKTLLVSLTNNCVVFVEDKDNLEEKEKYNRTQLRGDIAEQNDNGSQRHLCDRESYGGTTYITYHD